MGVCRNVENGRTVLQDASRGSFDTPGMQQKYFLMDEKCRFRFSFRRNTVKAFVASCRRPLPLSPLSLFVPSLRSPLVPGKQLRLPVWHSALQPLPPSPLPTPTAPFRVTPAHSLFIFPLAASIFHSFSLPLPLQPPPARPPSTPHPPLSLTFHASPLRLFSPLTPACSADASPRSASRLSVLALPVTLPPSASSTSYSTHPLPSLLPPPPPLPSSPLPASAFFHSAAHIC